MPVAVSPLRHLASGYDKAVKSCAKVVRSAVYLRGTLNGAALECFLASCAAVGGCGLSQRCNSHWMVH